MSTLSNSTIMELYNEYFIERKDPRVKNWLFCDTPAYPLLAVTLYLYMVYKALPKFMENRKPYNLKLIIQIYNIAQITFCCLILRGFWNSAFKENFSLGCVPVDYSDNPKAVNELKWLWWVMMLKLLEFVETFFFILRKKYSQASKLHVYHHVSTFNISWFGMIFIGGGMATYPAVLNTFIHVIMYSYYFLSGMGPTVQKKLQTIKPKITMLQMIQFCFLIVHSVEGLKESCPYNNNWVFMYIPDILIIFYMFAQFYKKSYRTKKDQ